MTTHLSDLGIKGRQSDIRTVDLMKGVFIVMVPEPDTQWAAHLWRKGHEILTDRRDAEELSATLRQNGHKAIIVRIAPVEVTE